jgi:UPF0042 nucleotide-binding protein
MPSELVILSGISGSGKTSANYAFEEMHYTCIGNLPIFLLDNLLEKLINPTDQSYSRTFLTMRMEYIPQTIELVKKYKEINSTIVLLYAEQDVILNRYKLTRHAHPLQASGITLEKALEYEYKIFEKYRDKVDFVINTTDITIGKLREIVFKRFRDPNKNSVMVSFISFGFKNGAPQDADIIFDVRTVPNPYYLDNLKNLSGLDQPVIDFIEKQRETKENYDLITAYLDKYLPSTVRENRGMIVVAIGCTGGQHRSVYFVEELAKRYKFNFPVFIHHRDVKRGNE